MAEKVVKKINPEDYKLQEDVARKYDCTTYPGRIVFKGEEYDLRKINVAQADKLVEAGLKILKKKEAGQEVAEAPKGKK